MLLFWPDETNRYCSFDYLQIYSGIQIIAIVLNPQYSIFKK